MASVSLRAVFLHDATDLGDLSKFLELDRVEELSKSVSGPATTRLYSGGNTRRTVGRGASRLLRIRINKAVRAQVEQLEAWAADGTLLLWRDPRGNVYLGGFDEKSLDIAEHPPVDRADVTATFAVVSDPAPTLPPGV